MKTRDRQDGSIVILGGGLAGLSTAFHLKSKNYVMVERENQVGGTARSFEVRGFTFDFTGHLLHLHNNYTRKLIKRLLKNNFYSCVRNTFIYSNGRLTPYPFQANTFGLPPSVVEDCVIGVLETHIKHGTNTGVRTPRHFAEWCRTVFGRGISSHFMIPYNEKLYQIPASKMTSEWCGPFVPIPRLEEVIKGALSDRNKEFGYNTTFLYPKDGGIQVLAENISKKVHPIRLGTSIKEIRWKEKKVVLSDDTTIGYGALINTIPLPEFLKRMIPRPSIIKKALPRLRFASIVCLNLGIKRSEISKASWIYFPEKSYLFYRVGFPMNFTPHSVPKGCSSLYVEIPMNRTRRLSKSELLKKARRDLVEAGILKPSDRIVVAQFLPIQYAYVIYDQNRRRLLPKIFSFLKRIKIQSIGRYGAWKYSFMEEAILDGKKAADQINKGIR